VIEPRNSFGNRCDERAIRNRWPSEHEDRNPEQSGCRDLAVGRLSPAVLCDHSVDGERLEHRPILTFRERAARKNVMSVRHIERRLNRIDAADEVVVLWGNGEWSQFLPPDCQKDVSGALAQRTNCILRIGYIDPDIAVHGGPRRPAKGENWRVSPRSGLHSIRGNRFGIRMRGIDQEIDALGAKIFRESVSTPEAASAYRDGLSGGHRGAAGKRNRGDELTLGERESKLASLRSPSQNQDVWVHVQPQP
jgi:hypothetical protein